MSKAGMMAFVERVANDEIFRADLIENPQAMLARYDLDDEDMRSIREDTAWQWLRDLWNAPPDWQ